MSVYDGRPPRPNPEPWPEGRVPSNNLERLIASAPRPPETPKPERRAAPAAQLDADLPPPREHRPTCFAYDSLSPIAHCTCGADQINAAIAPYAERIRLLTEELENWKRSSGLLAASRDRWKESARITGAAPGGWKLVPEVPTEAMIVAIERKVDEQLVASGMWAADMQRQDGADIYEAGIAAAPSPGMEDANEN